LFERRGGEGTMTEQTTLMAPSRVAQADAEALAKVGVFIQEDERSGTYVLRDSQPVCALSQADGLELLPIAVALKQYDWLHDDYYWKAVPADFDEVTARSASQPEPQGYFVRVEKGAKVTFPCQAALYMASADLTQTVHNVVIVEEDAELNLVTGCITGHGVSSGVHFAISEQYVGKNGALTNTMVHSWAPEVTVRPRSGAIVEEGGTFVSNYVSLRPAGDMQSNPRTWLNGRGASAKYLTIILGSDGSTIDIGGEVYLNGEDTSAELAHRGVSTGGHVYQKGLLVGNAPCRAHVDCAGMLVDRQGGGFILSVPGLKAMHPEARMSHEASIGKIAPEQVEYLQARGMEEREAISMIIRGFLDVAIEGLGPELDARIGEIVELAGHGEG
jgi:Fe-S cluster assembly scaffold protein SufB